MNRRLPHARRKLIVATGFARISPARAVMCSASRIATARRTAALIRPLTPTRTSITAMEATPMDRLITGVTERGTQAMAIITATTLTTDMDIAASALTRMDTIRRITARPAMAIRAGAMARAMAAGTARRLAVAAITRSDPRGAPIRRRASRQSRHRPTASRR